VRCTVKAVLPTLEPARATEYLYDPSGGAAAAAIAVVRAAAIAIAPQAEPSMTMRAIRDGDMS
jgi:hypothetical protein